MIHFFYHLDYSTKKIEKDAPCFDCPAETNGDRTPPKDELDASVGLKKHKGRKGKKTTQLEVFPTPVEEEPSEEDMVMHAKVFAAAVKYQVPTLQTIAASKFTDAVSRNWRDVSSMADAAYITYTSTQEDVRELRDIVADAINSHPVLLNNAGMESVILELRSLSFELLRRAKGLPIRRAAQDSGCPNCGLIPHSVYCGYCSYEYMGCCHSHCPICQRAWN